MSHTVAPGTRMRVYFSTSVRGARGAREARELVVDGVPYCLQFDPDFVSVSTRDGVAIGAVPYDGHAPRLAWYGRTSQRAWRWRVLTAVAGVLNRSCDVAAVPVRARAHGVTYEIGNARALDGALRTDVREVRRDGCAVGLVWLDHTQINVPKRGASEVV